MPQSIVWKKRLSMGWLIISLMIVAWGIVWLGNDLKWWSISFPLIPILIIIIGTSMVLNQILGFIYY